MRKCWSCARGENETTERDARLRMAVVREDGRPVRGYLCDDHVEMYADDGELISLEGRRE